VTGGREQYDLAPLFRIPLHDAAAVAYRHEVLRDLENQAAAAFGLALAAKLSPRFGSGWQDRAAAEQVIKEAVRRACGTADIGG
jgi:hypothetical protein